MRRLIPLLALTATIGLACGGSTTPAKAPAGGNQPAPGAGATGATTTTIKTPSYKGSSNSHYCGLSRQVQDSSKFNPSADLKTTFASFDKVANEFVSVAPSAIKADAHTVVNALHQLEQTLAAANWDITKLSPATIQALQDPSFSAAVQRITAYDTQVCGIGTPPST